MFSSENIQPVKLGNPYTIYIPFMTKIMQTKVVAQFVLTGKVQEQNKTLTVTYIYKLLAGLLFVHQSYSIENLL